MRARQILALVALAVFLGFGCYASAYMAGMEPTYDGSEIDLLNLYADPDSYDISDADGAAAIIVDETLEKTGAINAVTAVVFDFRGYDTMGEAFILVCAVSGSMVILRKVRKGDCKCR